MTNKSASSFTKVRRLISVLQKCNGKAAVGNSEALISPKAAKIFAVVGLILLAVVLFLIAFFAAPFMLPLIPLQDFSQSMMLMIMLLSFALSIKNIVTVLYTADDLPVLLPLPFSANQIVMAKLAVASRFPVILSVILLNSLCLGLGIRSGAGAAFIIGTVLSSILVPLTSIAVAALIIVVIFRLFGFIRNRDITIVLGGVFTIVFMIAYIFVSNSLRDDASAQFAATLFTTLSSAAKAFPNISFMSDFMFGGSAVGLLVSLGVTAAVCVLAMLAVKLFYLSTALAMQNTGTKNKAVTRASLSGSKKSNALRALTAYESKNTRRNPAYLVYGFAMTLIWPVLFALPTFLSKDSFMKSLSVPLDTKGALLAALFCGIMASCFACGFNVLPVSAFSREGGNFSALKALPLDFKDYYKSKRRFSMLICSIGSVFYIIALGIVCVATGVICAADSWVVLYSACLSFFLNLIIVNCMLLRNSRKPNLNWDSETEISRKLGVINVVAIIVGVIALIGFFIALMLSAFTGKLDNAVSDAIMLVVAMSAAVIGVTAAAVAFVLNKFTVKKAEQNLLNLE